MDVLIKHVNSFKFMYKVIVVLFVTIFSLTTSYSSFAQDITNCGRPDFSRLNDRGVFLWQNCSTGDWFLRTTSGGLSGELLTQGRLSLTSEIESISGFNLDPGISGEQDSFDTSNPRNIMFRFRVFTTAQDGFNFRIDQDSQACLFISNSANTPIMVGRNNIELRSPFNINTLDSSGCIVFSPIITLLLDDDDEANQNN